MKKTFREYAESIEKKECQFCGSKLPIFAIESYDHEGGWEVEGCKEKQWLFITCTGCGHQHSLQHLGVPR